MLGSTLFAVSLLAPLSCMAIGAIAVDDEVGSAAGYGTATGHDSEAAAKAAALTECRSAGNKSCEVVLTFKTCGAYAGSKSYYGVGTGSSEGAAEAAAIKECGNSACKVIVSDCE